MSRWNTEKNLRAIVDGERDPNKLASRNNSLIRASREQIAQSLEGDWREELLFVLEQSLEIYDMYLGKIRIAMPVAPLLSLITLASCTFICVKVFCMCCMHLLAAATRLSRCRK
jgi:hypothetical protein